jgi:hypothetical protein
LLDLNFGSTKSLVFLLLLFARFLEGHTGRRKQIGIESAEITPDTPVCDDGVKELAKIRGDEMAAKFQASQSAAVDRIEARQASDYEPERGEGS